MGLLGPYVALAHLNGNLRVAALVTTRSTGSLYPKFSQLARIHAHSIREHRIARVSLPRAAIEVHQRDQPCPAPMTRRRLSPFPAGRTSTRTPIRSASPGTWEMTAT